MTDQEMDRIADRIAQKVLARMAPDIIGSTATGALMHFAEHEIGGHGLVVNEARAQATPCHCFEYDRRTYCFSQGVIGLMSSRENPEQISSYCRAGQVMEENPGMVQRFRTFAEAAEEAHKEIEHIPRGERLMPWLGAMSRALATRGVQV